MSSPAEGNDAGGHAKDEEPSLAELEVEESFETADDGMTRLPEEQTLPEPATFEAANLEDTDVPLVDTNDIHLPGDEGKNVNDGSSNGHRRDWDNDRRPDVAASPQLSASTPDDTPSIQGSMLSSQDTHGPSRMATSRQSSASFLQPFDRRFQAKRSLSPLPAGRALSPAFLTSRSRQSSQSSQLPQSHGEADTPQAPWEVMRWTKLRKITGQSFSEVAKRQHGRPTCLAVGAHIAIGTSKGIILLFDYQQNLKSIIGLGTSAVESGSITSLAMSADHSTIAGGHENGGIFTWDLSRPVKPFLQIPPIPRAQLVDCKSDAHVGGRAILHLGFLGTRRTALVSADDGGMAFSHLATRGLGVVARSIRTTRLLGRYPDADFSSERARKPSSVLALSALPLGNVEHPTDVFGITAIITPYLLVIVSTTPIAETQYKAPRPKEVAAHSALSGCLAWFPAVKLKAQKASSSITTSKPKLVCCWSNALTFLEIEAIEAPSQTQKEQPPTLHFVPRNRWRWEEAIVAVQWLSRSVLGVLTISQRLLILEDTTLRMTDSIDLLQKHVYHHDLFSRQLQPLVEKLEEHETSMHGVVADAFYMSFRAYKGRLFLLGFNDVAMGTLSNWADRLLALMEAGDFIAAIRLATSYYNGDQDRVFVGLPEDDSIRRELVRERLLDMISASIRYIFRNASHENKERSSQEVPSQLAEASFDACISTGKLDYLFEDVYESYEDAGMEDIFLDTLEPHILGGDISALPPTVLKAFIGRYASTGRQIRLEELLCRLDTQNMDIDHTTALCKEHRLYDALIYIWTQALKDFVTPLIELLQLVKLIGFDYDQNDPLPATYLPAAMKVFPYLAYALTGRAYPSGRQLDSADATRGKTDLYGFLFSGTPTAWPKSGGKVFYTVESRDEEPAYPYLLMLLRFDASSFLSMLNEAFEDGYLNPRDEAYFDQNLDSLPGLSMNRELIINILLRVLVSPSFGPRDTIYLKMFIARNLPKYPQFIQLSGSQLYQILVDLCDYPSPDVMNDCQLSVEYLLSIYKPSNLRALVPRFVDAKFYRVLKSLYRNENDWSKLLQAHFEDPEGKEAVFDCISESLRACVGTNRRQAGEVRKTILEHAHDLTRIDTARTGKTLLESAPDLLEAFVNQLKRDSHEQFLLLKSILEVDGHGAEGGKRNLEGSPALVERYVRLMCLYDPHRVADYVSLLRSGDLRLHQVLPAMESSGVVDAAVVLMTRDGLPQEAMRRLVSHLETLRTALAGLVRAAADSPDPGNTEETIDDLLEAVGRYSKLGIWLCQGCRSTTIAMPPPPSKEKPETILEVTEIDLDTEELMWLDLIDATVKIVQVVSTELGSDVDVNHPPILDKRQLMSHLRSAVQQIFTAVLTSTAAPSQSQARSSIDYSFLRILRAFLTRASHSSPSLSDLRDVLADVFSAYAYEENILSMTSRFLDKDVFQGISEINDLRQRGWRPRGQVCEICRKRAWGPGAGYYIWEAWERTEEKDWAKRRSRRAERGAGGFSAVDRGKATATGVATAAGAKTGDEAADPRSSPLVVFSCRHVFHKGCMDKDHPELRAPGYSCVICG